MCVTLCCPHCIGDACQWRCWCEHASRVRHVCCPLCLLSRITHVITLISTRPRSAASQCPASIPTIMFTSAVGPETWDHPATIFHVTAAFLYAILYSDVWTVCLLKVLLEAKISILRNIVITDQVIKLLLIRTRGSFIDCDFCECDYQNGISMFAEIRSFSIIHQHHYYCYAPWWRNNLNFLLNV